MDALDKQIETNQRLAAQLLRVHAGRYPSWEEERARLIREKREAEERERQHAADLAEAKRQQAEAHAATQASGGVVMPPPTRLVATDLTKLEKTGEIEHVIF